MFFSNPSSSISFEAIPEHEVSYRLDVQVRDFVAFLKALDIETVEENSNLAMKVCIGALQ